jgi:mannose-6-phosphate isomerase-like protein (cupin superfamily)
MKRFLAGIFLGLLLGASVTLLAQHKANDKIVPPKVLVNNQKVKIQRWVLKPGERTPVHPHKLDHISVVIHGSTLRLVSVDGTTNEMVQKDGDAEYIPAHGVTHYFANVGKTTFESISIELKQ